MNNNDDKKRRSILEMIGVTLGMSVFTLFAFYFMPLLLILMPAMFIVLGIKNGIMDSIISIMTTLLIITYVLDPTIALYLLIAIGPITFTIIYTTKKRMKSIEVMGISAAVLFTSILFMFNLMSAGNNIISQIESYLKHILNIQIDMIKDIGFTSYEILETKYQLENSYKYLLLITPAMLLMFSLIISYINYSLSIIGLKKVGINIVNIPRFSRFKLPNNFTFGIIIMFLFSYIIKKMNFLYHETILINLVVLVGFMFFIQGLSVIDFLLIKMKVKKIPRILFILLSIFITPLVTVTSLLGLIDTLFDIRKIRRKRS